MENTNNHLILSPNKKHIPKPSIVEHRLRSGLEDRFGMVYAEQLLSTMTVDSCDEKDLIIHVDSAFQCDVIRKKLVPSMEEIISDVYGIHPVISIVLVE